MRIGCVASSMNRDAAITDPIAIATISEIERPMMMCRAVIAACSR